MAAIPSAFLAFLLAAAPTACCRADSAAERLLNKPDDWFRSEAGYRALDNILSWQTPLGAWPKGKNTVDMAYTGDRAKLKGTFDNAATTGELRALARGFQLTGHEAYQAAFLVGFDHILQAQYENGGWPQYFPPSQSYHRRITFNDNCMVRLLQLLRDAVDPADADFAWLDPPRRARAKAAVELGIDCIVQCQIVVDGQPTVWCAQHDERTLEPAVGRSYELVSLSGGESAGILQFLMELQEPSREVIRAVRAGVAWFKAVQIEGLHYRRSGSEPNLTRDPNAAPLWARFYEIGSNQPMFCDRDGSIQYDVEMIAAERRGGYTWYGPWGNSLLNAYAKWPYAGDDE